MAGTRDRIDSPGGGWRGGVSWAAASLWAASLWFAAFAIVPASPAAAAGEARLVSAGPAAVEQDDAAAGPDDAAAGPDDAAAGPDDAPPTQASLIATPRATYGDLRELPAPVSERHVFRVSYGSFGYAVPVAKLEYTVRHDGVTYEIRTRAQADGLVALVYSGVMTQVSSGRLGPEGLEPLQYVEQRGKRPKRKLSFDHEHRLLTTADRSTTVELPAGTQDRLSVLYQLALLARASPERFAAGTTHVLSVASLTRVSQERFQVIGQEVLNAAPRPIRALHLSRPAPEGSDDPRIDVWLGYDFQMLPVRIRFTDSSGRVLDQLIEQDG
jgi:hypothetical protein